MKTGLKTQEKILQAGKEEFLAHGYKDASLRRIAKAAGVTTGAIYGYYSDKNALFDALVAEPARMIYEYMESIQVEFDSRPAEVKEEEMRHYADNGLYQTVDMVYENYDAIVLIVSCSAGTSYEKFVDSLVELEVEYTIRYIEVLREKGHQIRPIKRDLCYILANAFFSGVFETVACHREKEEALEYITNLSEFYAAGWLSLLGDI